MAVNVGAAITALISDTLTVTRVGAVSSATGGYVTTPSPSSFTVTACVQPIAGSSSRWPADDAGGGSSARIAIYTTSAQTALRVPSSAGQADVVTWHGASWKIVRAENWSSFGYYRYEAEAMHT